MKKVLVTGANGFIGRRLCSLLLSNGFEVRALVLPHENTDFLKSKGIEIHTGNLVRIGTLKNICQDCSLVFHLAARVSDWGTTMQFYESIYTATENLLQEAVKSKVQRFILISSVAACGMGRHLNFPDENTPIQKSGIPYNDAKFDAEFLVRSYADKFQLPFSIIRPTNVTGAGSVWVRDPLAQMKKIFGLPLIDGGKYNACLIDVANLVKGIFLAGTLSVAENQTYFLMDDWDITWKKYLTDLAEMAHLKLGKELSFQTVWNLGTFLEGLYRPFGLRPPVTRLGAALIGRDNTVNTQKAQVELGWKSEISYQVSMQKIRDWYMER